MSGEHQTGSAETWIIEEWVEQFGQVVESMIDQRPMLTWSLGSADGSEPDTLLLEQDFTGVAEPAVWVSVAAETWRDMGTRVLETAGVESVSDEAAENTCREVLQQATGRLAHSLSKRLERDIRASGWRDTAGLPEGIAIVQVSWPRGETLLPSIRIAFAREVSAGIGDVVHKKTVESFAESVEHVPGEPENAASGSKTFDLLLDVALPVSVSFGRTEMAVRDVLKLTTGSIVELNRAVSEPVEVIVNKCVIARGEVVVVEGNYGVRISRIVSRQERLRTGSSSGAALRAYNPVD